MIAAEGHETFAKVVDRARSIAIVTHVNPDGDAIGSEVGIARYLLAVGKHVRVINQDATPETLRFLEEKGPAAEPYDPATHDPVFESVDLVLLVDNSAPDRLGRVEPVAMRHADKALCIDHHPTKGTPWRFNVLEDRASATCAMIYELIHARGYVPDRACAQALYAGIATDTGFFRFNSTRAETHEIAAALLRLGAEPVRCYAEVYERNAPEYTRLLGHALASLRLQAGGKLASVRIPLATLRECNAEHVDTSEITTPLLATDGVRVVVLFKEMDGGRVKVSLRSKGELDVHALATEFGGGGHRNASGIVMKARFEEAIERVLARAERLVEGPAA
ncbi:MAG TPA: bifunctional oligoribonuclease/PAP phosphatase NrnA [Candidatus Polarisedimenticolaceae bacterium]